MSLLQVLVHFPGCNDPSRDFGQLRLPQSCRIGKTMAFFLNSTTIGSRLRSHFQGTQNDSLSLSRRQFHIEPGPREQALLAEDPSLRKYKSQKKNVRRLKKVGDVLTVVVVAGCCYEIYVKVVLREEARKAKAAGKGAA